MSVSSCCCCCTLKTGTLVLGWLSLIGSALSLLGTVKQFIQLGDLVAIADQVAPDCSKYESCIFFIRNIVVGMSTFLLISNLLVITVSSLLIYGVEKNRPGFMTPYIVYQWIGIVLSAIIAIGFTVFFAINDPIGAVIMVIIMVPIIALGVHFVIVIRSYQTQIRSMQEDEEKEAII